MIKIISIGLITLDSKTEIIYCGDSETSNIIELNFDLGNQILSNLVQFFYNFNHRICIHFAILQEAFTRL